MHKALTQQNLRKPKGNSAQVSSEANNQTELTENSAQGTNVQNNQTELTENSA